MFEGKVTSASNMKQVHLGREWGRGSQGYCTINHAKDGETTEVPPLKLISSGHDNGAWSCKHPHVAKSSLSGREARIIESDIIKQRSVTYVTSKITTKYSRNNKK